MSKNQLIFIDTNVWFSAFYGSENSERLLKLHVKGDIKAVISKQVLNELVRNIKKKFPKAIVPLKEFLESAPPIIVSNPDILKVELAGLVDKKDEKILQSAINAKAKLFVTGNLKDFDTKSIHELFDIQIVSPKEAVDILDE